MDKPCENDGHKPCHACVSNETECEWSLANVNGFGAVFGCCSTVARNTGFNNAHPLPLQDYQMQMMLLEQQNLQRLRMAQEEVQKQEFARIRSLPPSRTMSSKDCHQLLLMLEQQYRERLSMTQESS